MISGPGQMPPKPDTYDVLVTDEYYDRMTQYADWIKSADDETGQLSELVKKKIISDTNSVLTATVDMTDYEETIQALGDKFKQHVKKSLLDKLLSEIEKKTVFTQQKLDDKMRIKAKVVVMSEKELMDLIDIIRNY